MRYLGPREWRQQLPAIEAAKREAQEARCARGQRRGPTPSGSASGGAGKRGPGTWDDDGGNGGNGGCGGEEAGDGGDWRPDYESEGEQLHGREEAGQDQQAAKGAGLGGSSSTGRPSTVALGAMAATAAAAAEEGAATGSSGGASDEEEEWEREPASLPSTVPVGEAGAEDEEVPAWCKVGQQQPQQQYVCRAADEGDDAAAGAAAAGGDETPHHSSQDLRMLGPTRRHGGKQRAGSKRQKGADPVGAQAFTGGGDNHRLSKSSSGDSGTHGFTDSSSDEEESPDTAGRRLRAAKRAR